MVAKLTKSAALAAVKSAVAESLATRKYVAVSLPGWEEYELHASKGRMYRVQTHPSTFIRVYHKRTGCLAWSITAGDLNSCVDECVRRSKEHAGWAGPVDRDYIPTTHPAYSV